MSLVLEDGSAPEGANSYATVAMADDYHSARGNATWTEASTSPDQGKTAALIRATSSLDALYGSRYPGTRTNGRDQALLWPRTGAEDAEEIALAEDEIPQEIIDATCELALRELTEAGSTIPDIAAGGLPKRIKADTVEIENFGSAGVTATFSIVDGILAPLLVSRKASFTASSMRG